MKEEISQKNTEIRKGDDSSDEAMMEKVYLIHQDGAEQKPKYNDNGQGHLTPI